MFSDLPPKADFPILDFANAAIAAAVGRRAVFVVLEGERPHP
jgi:hypothetical protein